MNTKIKVYIAGPYSNGDVGANVRQAIIMGNNLRALGFTPYIPHLTHFWHLVVPHEYEYWMKLDLEWLEDCDIIFRMDGESNGADREVREAARLKIPVAYTIPELFEIVEKK